jgi:hypothetical protein
MATIYNRKTTGLFPNGGAQLGDNTNFTNYTSYTTDSLSNGRSFFYGGSNGTFQSAEYIPVDTTKNYQMGIAVKGLTVSVGGTSLSGQHSGGHIGFACYDVNKSFISLAFQGDIGNTTLSRAYTSGSADMYITSNSGWYTGASTYLNYVTIFEAGGTYATPYEYSRETARYNHTLGPVLQGEGDYKLTLTTTFGRSLASGTPVSNGRSGGSYNYCLVADSSPYPSTWTAKTTSVFTGESRNSLTPFRYATKFIKFLMLSQYRHRTDSPTTWPEYAIDNIVFVERPDGTALPDSFFLSDRIK